MKKIVVALVGTLVLSNLTNQAFADGFVCEALDQDLVVKVYNHTEPELGTRNAAVMVLSDPRVSEGRRTIAKFEDSTGLLTNSGARYVADVDLRFADSSRKGELLGGTKLGHLATIELLVRFSYGDLEDGESTEGHLELNKRDGDVIQIPLECVRYLKNS